MGALLAALAAPIIGGLFSLGEDDPPEPPREKKTYTPIQHQYLDVGSLGQAPPVPQFTPSPRVSMDALKRSFYG